MGITEASSIYNKGKTPILFTLGLASSRTSFHELVNYSLDRGLESGDVEIYKSYYRLNGDYRFVTS